MSDDGRIKYVVTLDDSQLKEVARQTAKELKNVANVADTEGKKLDSVFNKIAKSAAGIGVAFSAQQIIREITTIRGEFQKLEVAFETMLGSRQQADALMSQLIKTAATTPFDLQGVANGAKSLLAYGMEANKVNETLVRLGDIASGLSIPLGDMVYLFGTTMVKGRMDTQDLNQFVGRGIPLISEFAKQFGVAESEVKELVTAGKIGFPQLEKAIISLTSEGGKFAGLMEKQSKTISGQIANLGDAIDMMFNKIGESSEGIISGTLTAVTSLVENFELVGKHLLGLVASVGTYRAVTILAATATKGWTAAEIAHYNILLLVEKAQKLLNATILKNPYAALAALAVAAISAIVVKLSEQTEKERLLEEQHKRLTSSLSEVNAEYAKEVEKLDVLKNKLESAEKGSDEWKSARDAIVSQYSQYSSNLRDEIDKTGTLALTYDSLTNSIRKSIAARGLKGFYDQDTTTLSTQDSLADIRQFLVGKHGEEYVNSIWRAIYDYVMKPGEIKDIHTHFKHYFKGSMGEMAEDYGASVLDSIYSLDLGDAEEGSIDVLGSRLVQLRENQDIFRKGLDNYAKAMNLTAEDINEILYGIKPVAPESAQSNKKQLEEKKTDLETQLGRLTPEEVSGEKGKEIKKQIRDIDQQLQKYSIAADSKIAQQAQKTADKQLEIKRRLAEDLLELQQTNQQDEINLNEEGLQKRHKQIQHDFDVRKKEIEAQESEWRKKNIEAGVETGTNGLTEEQSRAISTANALNVRRRRKQLRELNEEESQAMRNYLIEYGTYEQKRFAIAQDYAKRIAKAQTEGERKSLEAERDKLIAELDIEAKKKISAVGKLFSDWSNATVADMRKIAKEGQEALSFITEGKWDEKKGLDLGITKEVFDLWRKSPDELDRIKEAIKALLKSADDSAVGFERMKIGLDKIADSKNITKFKEGLTDLIGGINTYLQFASFISDSINTIANSIGSDTLKEIAEGINVALDAISDAMAGAQAGSAFGMWGAIIGALVGAASSLTESLSKIFDAKYEKQIAEIQDKIDSLSRSYEDLERAIGKSYSFDAADLISQQNDLLEQQKKLINQQKELEEDKKGTDDSKIKAYDAELHDIEQQIEDNKEAAIDAIFGEDIKSAIGNFADAIADAWEKGSSKVKNMRDTVREMMQSMVLESIKASIQASGAIEKIREVMVGLYRDGVLSLADQKIVYGMADELQKDIDSQYGWAESLFKDTYAQEGSSKGFNAMSQEMGNELNGRFTTMVELQTQQLNQARMISVDTSLIRESISEIRNLSLMSIGHLESLVKSNNELYQINARLGKIEENTSRL